MAITDDYPPQDMHYPDADTALDFEPPAARPPRLLCQPVFGTALLNRPARHDRRRAEAEQAGQMAFDPEMMAGQLAFEENAE